MISIISNRNNSENRFLVVFIFSLPRTLDIYGIMPNVMSNITADVRESFPDHSNAIQQVTTHLILETKFGEKVTRACNHFTWRFPSINSNPLFLPMCCIQLRWGFCAGFAFTLFLLQFGHRLEVIAKQPVSVLFGSQFKLSTYLLAVNEIETTVEVG